VAAGVRPFPQACRRGGRARRKIARAAQNGMRWRMAAESVPSSR
jgi:hypothetical protein